MATPFAVEDRHFPAPPRPQRARLAPVNAALERAWARGWASRPCLEPAALAAAARRATGLDDFGSGDGWRERLERLSEALTREAALTPLGTTIAYGQIVAALSARARAAALWRRHPEIERVPIPSPIVVVGQMRSGSTRIQRLLACDDQFAFTQFYESWNPLPKWDWLPIDDRKLRAWLALRVARLLNPEFGFIHPTSTQAADEEIGFHNIALYGAAFETQWRVPSFARHCEQTDSTPVYAEFRRFLQTVRWLRKDRDERPWILKVPQFTQDLAAVIETFPDARLVALHRDPAEVVGSSASLIHNQMTVQSDRIDRAWIGREALRKVVLRQQRVEQARARNDAPWADIGFEAVAADWRTEVAKVYALLERPLPSRAERRMERFMQRRSHARLRRHRYDLADFGLTASQVARATGGDRMPRRPRSRTNLEGGPQPEHEVAAP